MRSYRARTSLSSRDCGVVRIVRDVVALRLQLGDRGLQLGDRCRDVRQLDDVRLGQRRQSAELGERVAHLLLGRQVLRERREDAAGERDVTCLDVHPRLAGDGLHDRQERCGREGRSLVGVGVDDGGVGHLSRPSCGSAISLSQALEISRRQEISARRIAVFPRLQPRTSTCHLGAVACEHRVNPEPAACRMPSSGLAWAPWVICDSSNCPPRPSWRSTICRSSPARRSTSPPSATASRPPW